MDTVSRLPGQKAFFLYDRARGSSGRFYGVVLSTLVGAVLIAACAGGDQASPDDLQGQILVTPQTKADFVLTDTIGQQYSFAEQTEGDVTLLYFGYTSCPDICPLHLAQIARVLEDDPDDIAENTKVVFVSVDPQRDSPEAIRDYLDHFDTEFVGLTGTAEQLERAQRAVGVPPAEISGDGPDYSVDHAAWVIAYAPNGTSYSIYPVGTDQDTWVNDLAVLARMNNRSGT